MSGAPAGGEEEEEGGGRGEEGERRGVGILLWYI